MKDRAGFLTVVCTWMVILMHSLDARHPPKKHVSAGVSCKPKELSALTKHLMEQSLKYFEEANGKQLGTWSPGFPELHVHQHSPLSGSKVQCALLFMSQGLEEVMEDQKNNINPADVSLHEKLETTISKVKLLTACVKDTHGGECSQTPTPPTMPQHAFERKQWGRTLLKTARDYLGWLERKLTVQMYKVKGKNKTKSKVLKATLQNYLEGSGYLL